MLGSWTVKTYPHLPGAWKWKLVDPDGNVVTRSKLHFASPVSAGIVAADVRQKLRQTGMENWPTERSTR